MLGKRTLSNEFNFIEIKKLLVLKFSMHFFEQKFFNFNI